jgi:hypothetical protein
VRDAGIGEGHRRGYGREGARAKEGGNRGGKTEALQGPKRVEGRGSREAC